MHGRETLRHNRDHEGQAKPLRNKDFWRHADRRPVSAASKDRRAVTDRFANVDLRVMSPVTRYPP